MTKELWQKLAVALLAILVGLSAWGLKKVYDVDMRCTRMETKMEIWHTSMGAEWVPTSTLETVMLAGRPPRDQLGFAQRSMVRAFNQIAARDYDMAMKTLRIGLEETGLMCRMDGAYLYCESAR